MSRLQKTDIRECYYEPLSSYVFLTLPKHSLSTIPEVPATRLSVDVVIDMALCKFKLRPRLQFHEEGSSLSISSRVRLFQSRFDKDVKLCVLPLSFHTREMIEYPAEIKRHSMVTRK